MFSFISFRVIGEMCLFSLVGLEPRARVFSLRLCRASERVLSPLKLYKQASVNVGMCFFFFLFLKGRNSSFHFFFQIGLLPRVV